VPPSAVSLLILAAAMHATWNLLIKRNTERQIFTWLSLLVGSMLFTPIIFFTGPQFWHAPGRSSSPPSPRRWRISLR